MVPWVWPLAHRGNPHVSLQKDVVTLQEILSSQENGEGVEDPSPFVPQSQSELNAAGMGTDDNLQDTYDHYTDQKVGALQLTCVMREENL